jgi:hypothetical protein
VDRPIPSGGGTDEGGDYAAGTIRATDRGRPRGRALTTQNREPTVIPPAQRESKPTAAGGDIYTTLATGDQTDNSYYLTHSIVPPGGRPTAHIHTREE